MDRPSKIAAMCVLGSLLAVAGHPSSDPISPTSKHPLSHVLHVDEGEVVALDEIPSLEDDEFRYCVMVIIDEDGVKHAVRFRAKKALINQYVQRTIGGWFW